MPSIREWRQPYLLSNFDLVTASFTLIAGKQEHAVAVHLVETVNTGRGLGHAAISSDWSTSASRR